MKMNVDGAVARHRRGGAVSAICRDSQGIYLGFSAMVYPGVTDPVMLETFACREALSLAEDLNLHKIMVACDSQGVIDDINKGTGGPHAAIVHEIIGRKSGFQFCNFIHERRNYNFEAHKLAKFSCNLQLGRHVWLEYPPDPIVVPMNVALE